MKILVCNVGSTSLKYRLYESKGWKGIVQGKIERVGSQMSVFKCERGGSPAVERELPVPDYESAVSFMISSLLASEGGPLDQIQEIAAVGFKVVHAKGITGVQFLDEDVIGAMEAYNSIAPAHNPPYITAIRIFAKLLPGTPLVGSFETGFHETMPRWAFLYGIPYEWYERYDVRRYGFHGASHRYVSQRVSEILGTTTLRLISCHLGGSASLCAVRDGKSIDTSLGFSLQGGVEHSYRCGDIDPFIPLYMIEECGMSVAEVKRGLTNQGGLLGLSGISGDVRDLEEAAAVGNERARAALEVYSYGIKKYIGAYAAALGGVDAIAFAGGVGENGVNVRARICKGLEFLGVSLDPARNRVCGREAIISADDSRARVLVIPTNEELVVARQVTELIAGGARR